MDVNRTISPLGERVVSVTYIVWRSIMIVRNVSQNAMLLFPALWNLSPLDILDLQNTERYYLKLMAVFYI